MLPAALHHPVPEAPAEPEEGAAAAEVNPEEAIEAAEVALAHREAALAASKVAASNADAVLATQDSVLASIKEVGVYLECWVGYCPLAEL